MEEGRREGEREGGSEGRREQGKEGRIEGSWTETEKGRVKREERGMGGLERGKVNGRVQRLRGWEVWGKVKRRVKKKMVGM